MLTRIYLIWNIMYDACRWGGNILLVIAIIYCVAVEKTRQEVSVPVA
jgi:hypothetical protein